MARWATPDNMPTTVEGQHTTFTGRPTPEMLDAVLAAGARIGAP